MMPPATRVFFIASMLGAGSWWSATIASAQPVITKDVFEANRIYDDVDLHFRAGIPLRAHALCTLAGQGLDLAEKVEAPSGDECYLRVDLRSASPQACAGEANGNTHCATPASLYFFATSVGDRISSLRFRLNANSTLQNLHLDLLHSRAATLLDRWGIELPPLADDAIESGRSGKWQQDGMSVTFRRLDGEVPRFDLVVGFVVDADIADDPQIERRCNGAMCAYVLR
jgi:hypothetical protein